ncbi:MAG: hypothetical protein F4Z50_04600, partial [Gemmatimonadetes bacterium]|nr:hypothetical protein [Gemmatimonadota bacterium]
MRPIANAKPYRAAPAQFAALLTFSITLLAAAGCSGPSYANAPGLQVDPPTPDPRVGLAAGMFDAGEASWNLELLST